MQLSIERSDLCLIKEHRNYLLHECVLIEYPERSSVWQPRDCLGKFGNSICELEHSIELDRKFGLWPSRRGRARGSLTAAGSFFYFWGGTSTSNGRHIFVVRYMDGWIESLFSSSSSSREDVQLWVVGGVAACVCVRAWRGASAIVLGC